MPFTWIVRMRSPAPLPRVSAALMSETIARFFSLAKRNISVRNEGVVSGLPAVRPGHVGRKGWKLAVACEPVPQQTIRSGFQVGSVFSGCELIAGRQLYPARTVNSDGGQGLKPWMS